MTIVSTAESRPRTRQRIVDAAAQLFAAEGIHAVGVDRVCTAAGVSKRSLYQHFGGKDALIGAVVQARAQATAATLASTGRAPRQRITDVFEAQARAAVARPHDGCPFVSAAVELKDPAHPGSVLARAQKEALTDYLAEAARQAHAREPELLAQQLTLVFDGVSAWSTVRGESAPAGLELVELLLTAHGIAAD